MTMKNLISLRKCQRVGRHLIIVNKRNRKFDSYSAGSNFILLMNTKACIITCGPASVAQLDAQSDWRPGGCGFNPRQGRQHSFVEIDHEIISTVILSLPLIQEGQLSVSGKRMCTILVNRFED